MTLIPLYLCTFNIIEKNPWEKKQKTHNKQHVFCFLYSDVMDCIISPPNSYGEA